VRVVVWDFGVDLLYGDDTDVAETQDPRIEIASLDLEARAHNTRKHARAHRDAGVISLQLARTQGAVTNFDGDG